MRCGDGSDFFRLALTATSSVGLDGDRALTRAASAGVYAPAGDCASEVVVEGCGASCDPTLSRSADADAGSGEGWSWGVVDGADLGDLGVSAGTTRKDESGVGGWLGVLHPLSYKVSLKLALL